jgi:hypothetical protein
MLERRTDRRLAPVAIDVSDAPARRSEDASRRRSAGPFST